MTRIRDLVETLGALLLAAVVVIVLIQVVARYFLQWSISWPEELARYVAVWLTFIGAAAAGARHEQITVDLITPIVPARVRHVMHLVATVLGLVALGILVSAIMPLFGPAGNTASPGTGIPLRWVYLALPVGGALLGLHLISDLVELLRGKSIGKASAAESTLPVSGGNDG